MTTWSVTPLAARLINRLLAPADLRLIRPSRKAQTTTDAAMSTKYHTLVREVHDCFSALIFPGLQHASAPRRVDLLAQLNAGQRSALHRGPSIGGNGRAR